MKYLSRFAVFAITLVATMHDCNAAPLPSSPPSPGSRSLIHFLQRDTLDRVLRPDATLHTQLYRSMPKGAKSITTHGVHYNIHGQSRTAYEAHWKDDQLQHSKVYVHPQQDHHDTPFVAHAQHIPSTSFSSEVTKSVDE